MDYELISVWVDPVTQVGFRRESISFFKYYVSPLVLYIHLIGLVEPIVLRDEAARSVHDFLITLNRDYTAGVIRISEIN